MRTPCKTATRLKDTTFIVEPLFPIDCGQDKSHLLPFKGQTAHHWRAIHPLQLRHCV